MIKENISLQPFNTFGIGVSARYFASFQTEENVLEILESKIIGSHPPLILGGGSNILFTKDVDGLVLKNEIGGIELIHQDNEHIYVKVGAGVNWHSFVMYCIDNNYAGVENLALIPGNAGASPMQNIGAYGVEIKDVFHSLEAIHIHDKTKVELNNIECHFGYRESIFKNIFKNQFIITTVTYRLRKIPLFNISYGAIPKELERMGVKDLSIKDIALAVMNVRNSKLPNPKIIGNAGSFFKNPEILVSHFDQLKSTFPNIVGHATENNLIKVAAGWLMEQAGWKGFSDGDAGCYDKQALVLVNHGKATGKQILELSEKIINSVNNKFGIELTREVNVM
jgi:UDP-N-acetylmuramate dehydrogenase